MTEATHDSGITRRTAVALTGATLLLPATKGVAAPALPSPRPSRERVEEAISKIIQYDGEGPRTFLTDYHGQALAAADAADARARDGQSLGPLDGAIVSIKDLFDVAGEPTRAGSAVLAEAPPAAVDAKVVERLRAAGAVIIGKTNMVEFAFSGVGLNPHYGTPGNPADRMRVPGGSSSGAGVAVADGMCEIAIGTDTGGSTRIPAALCGVVGFKPSQARIPRTGVFPLSLALDSVGPIARSVSDCAMADAIMAGEAYEPPLPAALAGLRLGIPQGMPLADLDAVVASRFEAACKRLAAGGVALSDEALPQLDEMAAVNAPVPLVSVEAYVLHRDRLAAQGDQYDPLVYARMMAAANVTQDQHLTMLKERQRLIASMDERLAAVDALVLPTTPILAPLFEQVVEPDRFGERNRMLLRNTAFANFFDLTAISLPLPHGPKEQHSGLMLVARNGQDQRLFAIATAVETLLS
jgi:aspartyl-tRNA(Asn)/glutamyl-tRNA(Gln) amidotransferase subunit A